ncbi:MAG: hypothetical protein AB4352_13285 [Hormoscilla sp.]
MNKARLRGLSCISPARGCEVRSGAGAIGGWLRETGFLRYRLIFSRG